MKRTDNLKQDFFFLPTSARGTAAPHHHHHHHHDDNNNNRKQSKVVPRRRAACGVSWRDAPSPLLVLVCLFVYPPRAVPVPATPCHCSRPGREPVSLLVHTAHTCRTAGSKPESLSYFLTPAAGLNNISNSLDLASSQFLSLRIGLP